MFESRIVLQTFSNYCGFNTFVFHVLSFTIDKFNQFTSRRPGQSLALLAHLDLV